MAWSKDTFSKNLRYYMDKAGKTQKEMAEIIGVSAPTMSDWYNGRKFPRIDKIEKMALYFGCKKSDLIEDKGIREDIKKEPAMADELSKNKRELLALVSNMSESEAAVWLASLKVALGKQ